VIKATYSGISPTTFRFELPPWIYFSYLSTVAISGSSYFPYDASHSLHIASSWWIPHGCTAHDECSRPHDPRLTLLLSAQPPWIKVDAISLLAGDVNIPMEELYAGTTRHSLFNANLWNYQDQAPKSGGAHKSSGACFIIKWSRTIWPPIHSHMTEAECKVVVGSEISGDRDKIRTDIVVVQK